MKLINQSVELIDEIDGIAILKKLEQIGRVCYKSEDRITEDSYRQFITNILKRGHESVLEHVNVTLKWITDRGVSHELVRHRIAAYSQESTRYCNYSGNMQFIKPVDFELDEDHLEILKCTEVEYNSNVRIKDLSPQQARYFLPNGLKTEIVFTMNLRELRHMLKLRCAKSAHPQIQSISKSTLELLASKIPIIFDDLFERFCLTDC